MKRLAPALLLLACTATSGDTASRATAPLEPTTRDSAGVTIHEHPGDAIDRAPLIAFDDASLAVYAGSADSEEGDVSALTQMRFTSAGDLVGFDRSEQQLVVFPVDASPWRRFGRKGAGPGEIGRYGELVVLVGDTLAFRDGPNARIAIISPREGILRERALTGRRSGSLLGRVTSGEYVMHGFAVGGITPDPQTGPLNQPVEIRTWRGGEDSVISRFIAGQVAMWREFLTIDGGTAMAMYGAELSVEPQLALWDDAVAISPGPDWWIERRDLSGSLMSVVRINRPPTQLTDSMWAAHVDTSVAEWIRRDTLANVAEVRERIAARRQDLDVAVIQELVVTPNQVAWLIDYRHAGHAGWAATAFDREGRILGRIVEATGDPPVAIGNDRMAFRTEDDLGIATITVRRIVM